MNRTIDRLRGEFLEMPGLRLTADQVQRLCGVERAMCRAALKALVGSDFLRENTDGTYARMSDGVWQQAARRGTLALGVTRETNV